MSNYYFNKSNCLISGAYIENAKHERFRLYWTHNTTGTHSICCNNNNNKSGISISHVSPPVHSYIKQSDRSTVNSYLTKLDEK